MEKIKKLYLQLEKLTTAAERIEVLHKIAVQFMYIDLERYETTLNDLYELAAKSSSLIGLYYFYEGMGRLAVKRVNFHQALEHFTEAEKLATQMGNQRLIGMSLYAFAIVHVNLSNFNDAFDYAYRSVQVLKQLKGEEKDLAIAYTYLGITNECLGRYDDAEDAYAASIKIAPSDAEPSMVSGSMANYVVLKIKKKQYDEALEWSLRALDIMQKSNNKLGVAQTLVNTGEIYFFKEQYNEALKYYVDGLKLLKQVDNKKALMKAYVSLADVYMKLNGFNEAEEKLGLAMELLKEFPFAAAECKINGLRGELYYRQGKLKDSAQWLRKSVDIANEKGLLELQKEYGKLLDEVEVTL